MANPSPPASRPLPPPSQAPFDLHPDGPAHGTVLLFHGFTGVPYELLPLGLHLQALGFRAVCPVLPGHCTTPEDLGRTTGAQLLAAAHDAFHALQRDGKPILVGGLSAGGLLALCLSAAHPHTVAATLLLAPALRLSPEGELVVWLSRFGLGRVVPSIAKGSPGVDCADPEGARSSPTYKEIPVNGLPALGDLMVAAHASVPCVTAPVLVVHGQKDGTVPVSSSHTLAGRLKAAQSVELHILPRSGHVLPLDVERDQLCAHVERFLERQHLLAPLRQAVGA